MIYFNVTNIGQSYDSKFLCQHCVKPQQGSQSSYCVTQPFADPAGIFWVMVISGNISHCQDCSGKILQGESGKPLYDLVVQHKEHVLFQNPRSCTFKLSREFRNVYYHPHLSYIRNKFSSFQASQRLRISREALDELTDVHKNHILKEFGIKFVAK